MASAGSTPVLSFDAMLARNRSEFEQLSRIRLSSGTRRPASGTCLDSSSDIARTLGRRYGSQWRFDVLEERRDGDMLRVIGRLSIPARALSVTQSGYSRLEPSSATTRAISGTVDGIAFTTTPAPAPAADSTALRAACEMAAARCLRWFAD